MKNEQNALNDIKKQFLCSAALKDFQWHKFLDNPSLIEQELLLIHTVNSDLVLKYPVQIDYQKGFLKRIINKLEIQGSVIHDQLYEAYGRLVAVTAKNSLNFKHYYLNNPPRVISLKENINLISEGTTGLRTWQASLVLSEWVIKNQKYLNGKVILELGAGVGLAGITTALNCSPRLVYLTDCHPAVLTTLCENLQINIDNFQTQYGSDISSASVSSERCLFNKTFNSGCTVRVLNLPWEEVTEEFCKEIGNFDVVLAADIVYDRDLFGPLIGALRCFFTWCSVKEVIFACTERNKDTLDFFLQQIDKASFELKQLELPKRDCFIWSTETPVKIFSFKSGSDI